MASRYSPLRRWHPTPVFETLWRFATERQAIFWRRLEGGSSPWTEDPTLSAFKFTNAYRASDRVSQFLIKNVIYSGDRSPREVFFRTILFKLFNKIDTWKLLCREFGAITSCIRLELIDLALTKAMESGTKIYSGAYIMPSGTKTLRVRRKHSAHLYLLDRMMKDEVAEKLANCTQMGDAFFILRAYPMLGDFLAYQYLIDLNYSSFLNFSESEFVMPGPGAKSGLRKCFRLVDTKDETDIIRAVAENQQHEFESRGLQFQYLGGRALQLIDCQNLFCEIDKYARVVHPDVPGCSNRRKIKQRFSPSAARLSVWYPPKWRINDSLWSNRQPATAFAHGHSTARLRRSKSA